MRGEGGARAQEDRTALAGCQGTQGKGVSPCARLIGWITKGTGQVARRSSAAMRRRRR